MQNYNFICLLHVRESWSVTLREEHRLKIPVNRVPRRIFGSKREEVADDGEDCIMYASPDIIGMIKSRRKRWAGHVTRMGEVRNVYRILVGIPDRTRQLGRCKSSWEDNIRMDLREIIREGPDWMRVDQDRDTWRGLVNTAMNFCVPEQAGDFLTSYVTVSCSRKTLLQ
jgi:hypothetical protein